MNEMTCSSQMLGAGLLVGTAASAVGHVVSHFAKPKAGEIAPVAQPRLFSGLSRPCSPDNPLLML